VNRPRLLVRLAVLAALGVAAGPGCDRPDDRPALQQEALATAKDHDRRLDQLADRADELARRMERHRRELPHATLSSAAAEHSLAQARSAIQDRRGYLTGVRARLGKPGSVPELHALLDEMRARLSGGLVEATSDLAAVDSWLAAQAQAERAGAHPLAAEPDPPPPLSGSGSDDAPETDRSGAPIR
jgi:hypothetical protein